MPKPPRHDQVSRLKVFVSSSSEPDAEILRAKVDSYTARLNINLREAEQPLYLEVFHWYQVPPRRVHPRGVNKMFVERALSSHLVIAVLVRLLRPGTKEEIRRVLRSPVDLSVLYCPPGGRRAGSHWRLRLFMWRLRNRVLYANCGDASGAKAAKTVEDVLMNLVLKATRPQEAIVEHR